MTTVANHLTQKPQPLRQRAPEAKISAELDTLVLQMLEKNPAGRPQNMAVVEAMLCDAQIAAHVQTEWDDLELPEVDEAWRKKLADHMPSPRSRRLRRLALGLAVVAILDWAQRCSLVCGGPRRSSRTRRCCRDHQDRRG